MWLLTLLLLAQGPPPPPPPPGGLEFFVCNGGTDLGGVRKKSDPDK